MVQVEYEKLKNKPFPTKKLIKSGIMTSLIFVADKLGVVIVSGCIPLFLQF